MKQSCWVCNIHFTLHDKPSIKSELQMLNEIENCVAQLAENVVHQQMLTFSSHNEAQRYLEKTRLEMQLSIQHGNVLLAKGLRNFIDTNHEFVSTTSAEILKSLEDPEKFSEIIGSRLMRNDSALQLFMDTANYFQDRGDVETELSVIAALMALFPLHPQPYVCLGSLIWREDGIAAAEQFYSRVVQAIEDPALDYFAAECFYRNRSVGKAKEILQRALINTDASPVMYTYIRLLIVALLERCRA
jgi:hypothetical protein